MSYRFSPLQFMSGGWVAAATDAYLYRSWVEGVIFTVMAVSALVIDVVIDVDPKTPFEHRWCMPWAKKIHK